MLLETVFLIAGDLWLRFRNLCRPPAPAEHLYPEQQAEPHPRRGSRGCQWFLSGPCFVRKRHQHYWTFCHHRWLVLFLSYYFSVSNSYYYYYFIITYIFFHGNLLVVVINVLIFQDENMNNIKITKIPLHEIPTQASAVQTFGSMATPWRSWTKQCSGRCWRTRSRSSSKVESPLKLPAGRGTGGGSKGGGKGEKN